MKSYVKGVITGLLIGAVVSAIPAVAENIDVLFNEVRINVNGVDAVQWGEDIDRGDGESAPASILYNGTTYLPMRKLGELSGQQVYWNGDSKTVSMTGKQKDVNVVAEKPDKNGNVWKYYTFKDNENSYLGVKDEARGYERVYKIAEMDGGEPVSVTDDAIYFVKKVPLKKPLYDDGDYHGCLMKLYFNNDANNQDGEKLFWIGEYLDYAAFDGNILYYTYSLRHSNCCSGSSFAAYNYENDKKETLSLSYATYASNLRMESDDEKMIFTYELFSSGCSQGYYAIDFDKENFSFDKMYKVEDNNETN